MTVFTRTQNRAANAYLVRGKSRTILIDVGLSSNYPALLECLCHVGCPPESVDMVILSHEHLDHIGAAYHFGGRTLIAAHRLAAGLQLAMPWYVSLKPPQTRQSEF